MKQSVLVNANALVKQGNGVWLKADESSRDFIDYTDGDNAENAVYAQIKAAEDRSVFSESLDQGWDNWALEYHLGSKRSNIYRGLNLDGVKTVLEVGCGCGAITRFLGEQGFQVDAIEGTMRRAEIARLRTEDLKNVEIISSNYHELDLPKAAYDLVVFTGVLEYSGAYAAAGVSPEDQLRATLKYAQAALKKSGMVLIAIENRTGFKYLAGANEDHLNIPDIGLHHYAEPLSKNITRGIRTWSKGEWQSILSALDFSAFEFCYPFPDYKVPDAILSDHFLENAEYPTQVISGIHSRDYFSRWWPKLSENLFWDAAAQTKTLDQFANSFLIVAGQSAQHISKRIDFDFVRFASTKRKMPYRLQITKHKASQTVSRQSLRAESIKPKAEFVEHVLKQDEPFVDGVLLTQVWQQAVSAEPTYTELAQHIAKYGAWLDKLLSEDAEAYVDALPRNIIVDDAGAWHLIDQEWRAKTKFNKEILMFRTLLYFALHSAELLTKIELSASRKISEDVGMNQDVPLIDSVADFIRWGFGQLGMNYSAEYKSCLAFEQALHDQVLNQQSNNQIDDLLKKRIGDFQNLNAPIGNKELRVFWSQLDDDWHIDHSIKCVVDNIFEFDVSLYLPAALNTHRFVRIDLPADVMQLHQGLWQLDNLSFTARRQSGEQFEVLKIQDTEALNKRAKLINARVLSSGGLMVNSENAQILLDLNPETWEEGASIMTLSLKLSLMVDKMDFSMRKAVWDQSTETAYRMQLRQHLFDRQQQRIEASNKVFEDLTAKIKAGQERINEEQIERAEAGQETKQAEKGRWDNILDKFGLMRKPRAPSS